ncbi:MAG: patatin-like phospholipase family protein [Cyanobacteria bacterium P01_F01_bin.33]
MAAQVGLALGSGGARGWAHIGAIRALQEANIPVQCVAGTSIGAFVGALYAADALDELEDFALDLDWKMVVSLLDVVFPTRGLLDGEKVYDLLAESLLDLCIENSTIPFCCVATDLSRGREVRLSEGSMVDAVRASISIPGVFTPVNIDGRYLVDGGLVNPVPVNAVRDMGANLAIAINLNRPYPELPASALSASDDVEGDNDTGLDSPSMDNSPMDSSEEPRAILSYLKRVVLNADEADETEPDDHVRADETAEIPALGVASRFTRGLRPRVVLTELRERYDEIADTIRDKLDNWMPEERLQEPNIFDIIGISINVMEQQVTRNNFSLHPPDILIEPNLSHIGIFDFHLAEAAMQEGYTKTKEHIEAIQAQLK